jgi:hypothetical protein
MAKMMEKDMMGMCKCTCSGAGFLKMVLAAIFMAVGAYFAVWGLWGQWNAALGWFNAMVYYALGFFAFALGKGVKRAAMACCPLHGGRMCCK